MTPGAAFYCVSSAPYFLGAAAMINSLRLVGHAEPIHVMDCGLSAAQREALAGEARVVGAPAGREPHTLKPVLPLAEPAETAVLIDTDMVVTRSLGDLIDRADDGRLVAFRNHADRFRPEWGELLGLGELERRPYLCSGLVAVAGEGGRAVLREVEDLQGRVELGRSYFEGHDDDYPLLYADQDVLNAVVAARLPADRVDALDYRLAPMVPFEGLRLLDAGALRCAYEDGTEPYVVHHSLSPKPWQAPAYEGVYTRLLRRLLTGPDVPVRVPPQQVPGWLRPGFLGSAERQAIRLRTQLRWRLGRAA
jgi:hypothetical protein